MTYEKWLTFTEKEQADVPDEELPEIPKEQLRNMLIFSKCKRKGGELGWEVSQKSAEPKVVWLPVYKMKIVEEKEFWYKLDPTAGVYKLNLTDLEPSLDEEPIGIMGLKWIDFMEEHYPHYVTVMRFEHKFLTVARSVDKRAEKYRDLLEKQFEKANPRPADFNQILSWEQEKDFYVNRTVMREIVLVPITEA